MFHRESIMKKTIKIKCHGISIIFLLLGIIAQNGQTIENGQNASAFEMEDCYHVASFIKDNFATFVSKYNECFDDVWNASYVEKMFNVTIEDCGTEYSGVFLDFDSKNGYAVVGNNYTVYNFSIEGDSPFHGIESNEFRFSTSGGYYYLDGGEYLSVDSYNNSNESILNQPCSDSHYNGQDQNSKGCGNIINPDDYVNDKYGNGWKFEKSKRILMRGSTQYNLSLYINNKIKKNSSTGIEEVVPFSEGNCWFVSAYNALAYLSSTLFYNMPSTWNVVNYDPKVEEPNLYSKYYDASGNNISKKLYYNNNNSFVYEYYLKPTNNPNNYFVLEKLYAEVRQLVNTKFKKVSGGTISESCSIIERIAEKYNYSVDAAEHVDWVAYINTAISKIDQSLPCLWSTSNDTYGSHTMTVCGYRCYTKTTGWWIFQKKETKTFFEIKDGWSSDSRYYDISGHVGFSAIVTLEF